MATALQQQLAQIARSSTNQLDLKAQKVQHSKSLLFEARDAANQTFDTVYQICAEGFQELCMLDARFAPFAQNLFSEQSKGEDRGQMTAQENQELDKVIDSFLGLVGGRLLLRPAIKALEWLVRRFRVHEYNTDSLILAFLPYHANAVFPTMLSILPKTLPPAYKFLHPYMTSLSSPPRHAVLYAAINNPGFFAAFNQYTIRTAAQGHHSASSLGFWASITAQAINGQLDSAQSGRPDVRRQREEDLLLRVIPLLQESLRIKNVPELFLGSCIIVTILVTKAQLEDKLLDGLMDAIVKTTTTQTLDDALTCLAVVSEERQSLKLPRSVSRSLLRTTGLQQHLAALSEKQLVARLYAGLAIALLDDQNRAASLDLVEHALTAQILTRQQKAAVVSALLSATPRLIESDSENVARIFSSLCQSPTTMSLVKQEAANAQLTIESLETLLRIPLALTDVSATSDDADVDMVEAPEPAALEDIQTILAALPSLSTQQYSFLAAADVQTFDSFAHAMLTLLQRKRDVSELLDMSPFHTADPLKTPTLLSFLARVWTGKFPAIARMSALRAAVKALKPASSSATDAQAIVPYALFALSDSAEAVRRAAADLLILISSLYKPSGDKAKVQDGLPTWGRENLYAERTKDVAWLSSQDAYKILATAVLPSLEECVMDPAQISRLLRNALNGPSETQPGHPSAGGVELKSALRASLFSFLCSHATATAILNVRVQLLSFLAQGGKAGSAAKTQQLIPSLRTWSSAGTETRAALCSPFHLDVSDVDGAYIACLTSRSSEELTCLKSLACGELGQEQQLAISAIRRFKQLWSSMKPASQIPVASFLLELTLDTKSDDVSQARQSEAIELLRQVTMSTEVLASLLDSVPSIAQLDDKPPATKRRRTSRSELAKSQVIDASDLHAVIRRLTVVLELIEGSKPERHPELLKSLFHVLGELQHYKTQIGSSLVYLQQLVIGCLLSIVESLEHNPAIKVDRSVLRADLIVECVRSSTNAQVHNSALLLIASLASWAPDLVLHSVMPIFTFMTSTILRQGDDYSAHIIDQTISRVVPPLASSLRKKNKDLLTGSAELLLSFTAAFEHIPLHRRLRLFTHLVTALGPQDSLAAIVAMLFEKFPTDRRVPVFAADLMTSFPPLDQLTAALKYLDLVQDTLQPKRTISELLFVYNEKSPQQVEQSIVELLRSLAKLLRTRQLHVQIMRALERGGDEAESLQSRYATLLEKTMSLSQQLKSQPTFHAASGQVLSSTLALLPTSHYILSAKSLLDKPEEDLRLMVLQSLETRSRDAKPADSAATAALLEILPGLTAIVGQNVNMELKHNAIACIDIISEKFGKKNASVVLSAAETIASESAFGSKDGEMRVVSLLCLSTMVEVLKDDLLPVVPRVFSQSLEYLDASSESESGSESLHDAVYTFLGSVLEHLPWMFTEKTLAQALRLAQKSAGSSVTGRQCAGSREQFCTLASRQLDAKTLLLAIDGTFDHGLEFGYQACQETLRTLHKVVTQQTKSVLLKQALTLFSILNKTFDLRRQLTLQATPVGEAELTSLEEQRDNLTLDAIMRLNDAAFRPFFMRLVQWAAEGLPKKDKAGRILRLTSLYKFLARFFDTLKVRNHTLAMFSFFNTNLL